MSEPHLLARARDCATRAGASFYYEALRTLGLPAIRRRWGDAAVILCYHNIVADNDRMVGAPGLHLPFTRFARQLRWLAEHYQVVPLQEFVRRSRQGGSAGPRRHRSRTARPLAAITFDDGYAGVFKYAAPLLRRLGLPATVFVVAEAPGRSTGFWWDQPHVVTTLTPSLRERWLRELRGDGPSILSTVHAARAALPLAYQAADWPTIRAHADCIEIGVHSATHRFLPSLTDEELDHEVVASRELIRRQTGVTPRFFAYPYGACDARTRAAVGRASYQAAFGLAVDEDRRGADPWAVERINVPSGLSPSAFEAWTAGLH